MDKVEIVNGEERKSMSTVETIFGYIGFDGIIMSGKDITSLILGAIAIIYYLQFVVPSVVEPIARQYLYSFTPLIPIYLSCKNMEGWLY